MELRDWAETILAGTTLAEKLSAPVSFTDAARRAKYAVPALPGRPGGLSFGKSPARMTLDSERGRGEVLHTFANHELLALELMALMLLRFPDAPAAFRRGLAATMRDEQRHLQSYLDRMACCGVSLGEVSLSRFFWDALADVPSLRGFVAGMSLGFEQANLDFSLYWQQAFAAAGDHETAAVLADVYTDEIRHVAHGRVWFGRWSDTERSLFGRWAEALPHPLTPARAKGLVFDVAGRERAGLQPDYIETLKHYAHSRGRTPRVYWYNGCCEAEIAAEGGYTPPRPLADLDHDLAWLMAILASDDDVVVAPEPSPAFLDTYRSAGFAVPQRVQNIEELEGRRLASLHPWGWSPRRLPTLDVAAGPQQWDPAWRARFERTRGVRCTTVEEVVACATPVVVKAPLSAAGRGRVFSPLDGPACAWIAKVIRQQGFVCVEPWLDKVLDLSVIGEGSRVLGVTRFETDKRGQWVRSLVAPWTLGLPAEVARFVHDDGRRPGWIDAALAEEASVDPISGPWGIDALIHRTDTGLSLVSRVERNARYTMGRLALALRPRVRRGWLRLVPSDTPLDPVIRAGRLVSGRLPLTDPARARRMIAVLESF